MNGSDSLSLLGKTKKNFEKGLSLYSKKLYWEALPLFESLNHPEFDVLKFYHLGLIYIQLGDYEKGLSQYRKIREIPSKVQGIEYDNIMYGLYINMGSTLQVLARQKKERELYEEAIMCYIYSLQIKESDARVWNNLGNAYLEVNNFKEAIKSLNKAIELDDEFPEAHYSLSLVYESMKIYEKAIVELEKGLKWKSRNKIYLNRITALYFGIGKFEKAKEYAKRVLAEYPEDINALKNISLIYYNLSEYAKASRFYSDLLKLKPDFNEPELKSIFDDLKKRNN